MIAKTVSQKLNLKLKSNMIMKTKKIDKKKNPLSQELLRKMNAYWRAANYLSVGQLYLLRQSFASRAAETVSC